MKYFCSVCFSTMETLGKDEDAVVIVPCGFCTEQATSIAHAANEKLANMMARHTVDVVNMTLRAPGVKL